MKNIIIRCLTRFTTISSCATLKKTGKKINVLLTFKNTSRTHHHIVLLLFVTTQSHSFSLYKYVFMCVTTTCHSNRRQRQQYYIHSLNNNKHLKMIEVLFWTSDTSRVIQKACVTYKKTQFKLNDSHKLHIIINSLRITSTFFFTKLCIWL